MAVFLTVSDTDRSMDKLANAFITQLSSLYGADCAKTIINNCDQMLYLGGQDIDTARLISEKANKPPTAAISA